MKRVQCLTVALAILFLPGALLARNPHDLYYTPPVDSVVVWFNDACNQHQQVRAFLHVSQNAGLLERPFRMVKIEPIYDLPQVKAAFVNFVMSLSLNRNQRSQCSNFLAVYLLGEMLPSSSSSSTITDEDSDEVSILPYILSMYMNLGYTANLTQIADSLYRGGDQQYWAYILEKLGNNYFLHLKSEIQTKPDNLIGIWAAYDYLQGTSSPNPILAATSIQIFEYVAVSGSFHQKLNSLRMYIELYGAGYVQLKDEIELLTKDANATVKSFMIEEIRQEQRRSGQMMNFLQD